ncbi:MAG: hypothetical protein HY677_05480 [Chloroflexi bacterium]|nr:hypothetical protein [Chloroflexota bacterium]
MCRMCDWLGEGQIWYKNPKLHANRMYKLREPGRKPQESLRGNIVGSNLHEALEAKANGDLATFNRLIAEKNAADARKVGAQPIPLNEAIEVIKTLQMPVAAMMCICRKATRAEEETNLNEYSCLALGTGMFKWERWPERYRGGVEFLKPQDACDWLEYWDKRGMMHLIMEEGNDFLGGICNCDYPDCNPIRQRVDYGLDQQLVKGEYICEVDFKRCNGCGECLGRCHFNALKFEVTIDRPSIDPMVCFGCALCQTACNRGAINLVPRSAYPALRNVW